MKYLAWTAGRSVAAVACLVALAGPGCGDDDSSPGETAGGSGASGGGASSASSASSGAGASSSSAGGAGGGQAGCDPTAPFEAPEPLLGVNSGDLEQTARFLPDLRTVFFARGVLFDSTLYTSTRPTADAPFEELIPITGFADLVTARSPAPTADGLTIYFEHDAYVYRMARPDTGSAFGEPTRVDALTIVEKGAQEPYVLPDGDVVYFSAQGIYRAEIGSGGRVGAPVRLPELDVGLPAKREAAAPVVTPDERTLYLTVQATIASSESAGQIHVATRSSAAEPFSKPELVAELAGQGIDAPSWVSADGCLLVFGRATPTNGQFDQYEVYVARRP